MRYVNCGTDNIWIDCAQLENGAAMSAYNLVQNGGFEDTSSTVWEAVNCTTGDKYYTGGTYGRHFYMKGEGSKDKRLIQKIYINRPASKVFLSISGYAKAESVPIGDSKTRKFALSVGFHFTDGSDSSYQYISFNPDYAAGWQYASGTVGVKDPGSKTVDYVYLRCCYYQNANGANFDRIKVNIDECGTSYTYDNDGNLISAKDNAGRHESYNYNNASDMTKLTTADNKAYKFTYSDKYKHRMLSATSESSGVKNSFTYDASGNLTKTRVDKSGYAKYIEQGSTYTGNGNYLATSTAANGYSTTYNYNAYKGTLNSVTDANGKETKYTYDANTDRMTSVEAVDKASAADNSKVEYTYAKNGQLTSIKSPGSSPTYNFEYDNWGNNTEVKVVNQTLVTNTYKSNNGLLTQQKYGNEFTVGHNYDSLDRETSRVYNNGYDNVGNILTECSWISSSSKPVQESYTYDAKNQLVKHDSVSLNAIYTYEYDLGGNIKSKTIYNKDSGATSTINYIYGNSAWGDELTSYNGESIVYDKIGNPTSYRGWGMTWQGRQLTKAVKDKTVTFTYDSEGIRTSKSDGTNTTKYLLNGTQILAQKTGSTTLSFFYDQQGNRVAMADGNNNFYYYIYNVQGDVIALADASTGKLAVTYTYDAWGKVLSVNDTTANSVGTQNPFRYKGYYYDTETSLYYLQSRYYDPEVGRFINADAFASTDISGVLSANMFAYCENNPVMRDDPTGEVWTVAVKMLVGAAVSMASYAFDQSMAGEKIDIKELAMSAAEGAVTAVVPTKYATAISAVSTFFKSARAGNDFKTVAMDVVASVGSSLIGAGSSYLGGKVKLTQFKNSASKRELKSLANTLKKTKRNGNEFKQLSKWKGEMDNLGAKYFMGSPYAQYCGYLGSVGFSLTYNVARCGR